jgi:hypothetical protein
MKNFYTRIALEFINFKVLEASWKTPMGMIQGMSDGGGD